MLATYNIHIPSKSTFDFCAVCCLGKVHRLSSFPFDLVYTTPFDLIFGYLYQSSVFRFLNLTRVKDLFVGS